jgi:hypothetical protein
MKDETTNDGRRAAPHLMQDADPEGHGDSFVYDRVSMIGQIALQRQP